MSVKKVCGWMNKHKKEIALLIVGSTTGIVIGKTITMRKPTSSKDDSWTTLDRFGAGEWLVLSDLGKLGELSMKQYGFPADKRIERVAIYYAD